MTLRTLFRGHGPRIAAVVALSAAPALAQEADDVEGALYLAVAPSVFSIEMRDDHDVALSRGSAFLIDGNRLITNAHVVDEGRPFLRLDAVAVPLTVERVDDRTDLALLRASAPLEAKALELAGRVPREGSTVWVLGNPQGLDRSLSMGIVSAVRREGSVRLLQHTAPISPGSSGGPVLDDAGRVVGVTLGAVEDGQNLNFAVPVDRVRSFLEGTRRGAAAGPRVTARTLPEAWLAAARNRRGSAVPMRVESYRAELTPADASLESGSRYDDYEFRAARPGVYFAKVRSAEFDAMVRVVSLASGAWWEDDDGDVDRDACVRFAAEGDEPFLITASSFPWPDTLTAGRARGGWYTVEVSASPCRVEDNRWGFVGDRDGATWWVDVSAWSETGPGRAVAWVRERFDRASEDGVDMRLYHREFDCTFRRMRLLQRDSYSGGRRVERDVADDARWESPTPESIGERVLNHVCRRVRS